MILKSPFVLTAYSLHASLHWKAILTHDCILGRFTEWLVLNLYYGECELASPML